MPQITQKIIFVEEQSAAPLKVLHHEGLPHEHSHEHTLGHSSSGGRLGVICLQGIGVTRARNPPVPLCGLKKKYLVR